MFVYCFNNPVNMGDSTGDWPALSTVLMGIALVALTVAAVAVCVAAAPVVVGVGTVASSAVAMSVAVTSLCVSGSAAVSAVVARTVEETETKTKKEYRNQSVYVMRDSETKDVQYVGRTNNPGRRQTEHARDPNKSHLDPLEVKFTGLTKSEARVVEQILISAYSLQHLDNARREISVLNIWDFQKSVGSIINIFEGTIESELLCLMEF